MSLSVDDFAAFHLAVHGTAPFEWQTRLLGSVVRARAWPRVLDLPTGSGKTTCVDIGLFALALDAEQQPTDRWCPRRIAMVVDRRVVVDQVAERGRKLLRMLTAPDAATVLRDVAALLRSLSNQDDGPIGVYTLRGGMPKDDGWARSPDRPLVLASTVDQLGSRLLLQGYGVSTSMRPVHAGLLGNELLLLLDEVHLSQPFADTLDQLTRLRKRFVGGISCRFHYAFLSATPGIEPKVFHLSTHEKRPTSPLGTRLHASKPARLLRVEDRAALERTCVEEGLLLLTRHDVLAVVANRVASASTIARQIRERVADGVDVVLLTGRMRPLDRDDALRNIRSRIMTGRDRATTSRKLIVVGTQCIEAGADFDFDALVTEAASLDALRQRFGRVDRLGTYGRAEGVIVHAKDVKDDPVYGEAAAKTVAWIGGSLRKKTKDIDFGVLALPQPAASDLEHLLAPRKRAPVLLPAYLDLWMQTSPSPTVVPDVGLWLHGPDTGPADVQVVWRADLTEDDLVDAGSADRSDRTRRRPMTIVAAVRPSSLEAVSVPFLAVRRWLRGGAPSDIADVEGVSVKDDRPASSRLALRWDGDDSAVIPGDALRPGDTIVVPATRGGIAEGCFQPESLIPVVDLAERAALLARGRPVLRLQKHVVTQLGLALPLDDVDAVRQALGALAETVDRQSWNGIWLEALSKGDAEFVVDGRNPWTVIESRRVPASRLRALLVGDETVEDGVESTTDPDDSSYVGRVVTLSDHCARVEHLARMYGTALGLSAQLVNDLALAAWLHDIGKADRRFQVLLRGGSEISLVKDATLWAKSRLPSGGKWAQRVARDRSRYPARARHEVQSVAMIEHNRDVVQSKARDIELVLHLVGSHHGQCRPFAPAVEDNNPVDVALADHYSEIFGRVTFPSTSSRHELYRLDTPLADRFWQLAGKYGWLELCWLEAVLRLADHRASETEQISGGVA